MKKIRLAGLFMVALFMAMMFQYQPVKSHQSGAPSQVSNSPSDGSNCTSCHNGTAASLSGLITSNVPTGGYTPGTVYTITGTATSSGLSRFGFEISPQTSSGTLVGSLTITNSTQTQIVSTKWVTHKSAGTTGTGSKSWSFNWTAPVAGTGSVTFYGSFLYANNNGSSSGDATKVSTLVIPEATTPPASVSIALTGGSNPACAGTSLTFTATPTNGGTTPTYQWKVNGSNVGTNNATYSTSSLTNGQIVTCVMTPSGGSAVTSNSIIVTINPLLTPAVTVSASSSSICPGQSVTFTAAPTNGGSSPVYQWKLNGGNVGTNATTYTTTSLVNGDVVSCVLTSNATCASPSTGTSNSVTMTVGAVVVPSVTITTPSNSVCTGANVTFTATPVNGGAAPTYQWKKNGTNIGGATSSTYSTTTLVNGDVISCVLTSNAACASPITGTSNSITMTVGSSLVPSVTITTPSNSVCSGTYVTFIATPVNGGSAPMYQWKKNGTDISGATSSTYSSASFANGDVITVVLTSNSTCVSTSTATSNAITLTVSASVTPTVSITSGSGTTICAGTGVTFTATPVNGGGNPTYQWKKNGTDISGATSSGYTTSTLTNGDIISVVMTSSSACATTPTATSNAITMVVTGSLTPSVTIMSNLGTGICVGQSVTFTATPVNGGSSPGYQWKKNGTNIGGATASTYSSTTIANGDVITVVLTSNAACAVPTTASSNSITMSVVTNGLPSVSVAVNPGNVICTGQSATFTATPSNGGTLPTYQWQKNGTNISGATSATYTTSSLANGDVISVNMTSNSTCVSQTGATSNTITISLAANSTAVVSISSTTGTNFCLGQTVTFNATPVNGGNTPVYQWKKNGADINGATSSTYSTTGLANGDVITVAMTSSLNCVSQPTVQSNSITMVGTNSVTPVISITSDGGLNVCSGQAVTFSSTVVNGGSLPNYQWTLNGATVSSATSYSNSTLANGDIVSCVLTSNAICATSPTINSNSLTMTVFALPVATITENSGTLTGPQAVSYQWKLNNSDIANATSQTFVPVQNGSYSVEVTDAHGCKNTSSPYDITTLGINETGALASVSVYPNPTEGFLFVDLNALNGKKLWLKLFDMDGHSFYEKQMESANGHIIVDVQSLAKGVYVLQVSGEKEVISKRVVVGW